MNKQNKTNKKKNKAFSPFVPDFESTPGDEVTPGQEDEAKEGDPGNVDIFVVVFCVCVFV